jgi:hypothetical protein
MTQVRSIYRLRKKGECQPPRLKGQANYATYGIAKALPDTKEPFFRSL